jgi:hypothetical protein
MQLTSVGNPGLSGPGRAAGMRSLRVERLLLRNPLL